MAYVQAMGLQGHLPNTMTCTIFHSKHCIGAIHAACCYMFHCSSSSIGVHSCPCPCALHRWWCTDQDRSHQCKQYRTALHSCLMSGNTGCSFDCRRRGREKDLVPIWRVGGSCQANHASDAVMCAAPCWQLHCWSGDPADDTHGKRGHWM